MSLSNYFQGAKPPSPKKNIFISYREKDTAGETGRLVDSLKQYFDEEQIFMDIDKIEPGVDFTQVISKSLDSCDVMLAIIGPNWAGSSSTGGTRIKAPNDWVRLEIATALARNIRVVPVLVDDALLPTSEELPDDLQPLIRRQAYEISNKRWRYDTENLIAFLEKSLGIQVKNKPQPVVTTGKSNTLVNIVKYGLIGVGALFIILLIYYGINGEDTTQPANTSTLYQNPTDKPATNDNARSNVVSGDVPVSTEAPAENTRLTSHDLNGTWDDKSGMYYVLIVQDGKQVKLDTYSKINGIHSGEGSGVLTNDKLVFDINFLTAGIFHFETRLSPDGNVIEGTLNVENNGAKYTEPLVYYRRK